MRRSRIAMVFLTGVFLLGSSGPAGAKSMKSNEYVPTADQERQNVPAQWRWNLSAIYPSLEAWEAAFSRVEAQLPNIASLQNTFGALVRKPKKFEEQMDQIMSLVEQVHRLEAFAYSQYSTDRNDSPSKARLDRSQALSTRLQEAIAFVEPELLAMSSEDLRSMINQHHRRYSHYLDDLIRRKAHVLPAEQERILALTGDLRAAPYSIVNALEEDVVFPSITDEDGKTVALSRANFGKYRASSVRKVRSNTVTTFFDTLATHASSFAATLDAQVKANIMMARARGYSSAIAASLDDNAIPVAVYDTLVSAINDRLPATLHRYVALRKKVMKLDELHYYDLYNPLFAEKTKAVTYTEGLKMMLDSLELMGKDYLAVLKEGVDPASGWADVYPNRGKRGGAYCNAAYRVHPIVFLNFMNELDDVFTLTHEYGHAMNFYLTHQAQEYVNAHTSIFLAEIASTFHEEMLLHHLLKQATDKQERLILLNKRIENIRTTVFRQVMFAEFERAIHVEVESGGAITADRLNEIYAGLVKTYYGPDYVFDARDAIEWAYIPHFYYNFYVYQYATGLMSAISLASRMQKGEKGLVEGYIEFLKAGNKDYAITLLQEVGVDLTKPDDMVAALDLFVATLDEIEQILLK